MGQLAVELSHGRNQKARRLCIRELAGYRRLTPNHTEQLGSHICLRLVMCRKVQGGSPHVLMSPRATSVSPQWETLTSPQASQFFPVLPQVHHLTRTHMIECLWCHHLERSTESCSTAKLSLKSLHSAPRWAPASCQCPVKWLMTADWDMWKIWENIHTISDTHVNTEIFIATHQALTHTWREQDKQAQVKPTILQNGHAKQITVQAANYMYVLHAAL